MSRDFNRFVKPINYRFDPSPFEGEGKNIDEAFILLGLIDAEFQSDPMSTQCFDQRIVERVRACVQKHKRLIR